jgi:ribonuclease G
MKQELLITRDKWQVQIALLEDGRLVEHFLEPSHLDGLVGNLYVGRINRILAGMESAFVDVGLERDGFLYEGDMGPAGLLEEEAGELIDRKSATVKNLHEGDRILVQIIKEPMGAKGSRLSTDLALPGHYLIFMPFLNHVAVSRKIAGPERGRLKDMLRSLKRDAPGGFIVRTAAEGVTEEELAGEMQALSDLWSYVWLKSQLASPPALVHQEADLVGRAVREILLRGEGTVVTDDEQIADRCRELMHTLGLSPTRIKTWTDDSVPLFDHYHIQQELDKALRPRVWLPSGGCIVLQSTEALVAIDVNSGRYTGKKSLEETAFTINMEAVEEIVRQIRLRSLGGIIVIDFIDMSKKAHREALVAKLNEALKTDRAKSRILNISEFGLVEMTRKRSHRSLERVMTGVCSCCEGRGRVPAAWRIAQQIVKTLEGIKPPRPTTVTASPDVIRYMEENRQRLGLGESIKLEAASPSNAASYSVKPR